MGTRIPPEDILKKREFKQRRDIVNQIRSNNYKEKSGPDKKVELFTDDLAYSTKLAKEGNYDLAMAHLKDAMKMVEDAEEPTRTKWSNSVDRRLQRLARRMTTGDYVDNPREMRRLESLLERNKVYREKNNISESYSPKVLLIGGTLSILGSLALLSNNVTGNVIGSLPSSSSNWIGVTLFIIGVVGLAGYFKR